MNKAILQPEFRQCFLFECDCLNFFLTFLLTCKLLLCCSGSNIRCGVSVTPFYPTLWRFLVELAPDSCSQMCHRASYILRHHPWPLPTLLKHCFLPVPPGRTSRSIIFFTPGLIFAHNLMTKSLGYCVPSPWRKL